MTATPRKLPKRETPRNVALASFPGLQPLDVVGPLEVFHTANQILRRRDRQPAYALEVVAPKRRIESSSGLRLDAVPFARAAPPHTLLVGGGTVMAERPIPAAWTDGLKPLVRRAKRVVSVCTGVFALGELGLLEGRRCTTHWLAIEALSERFPGAKVDRDVLYTSDGSLYTSAGVTSGIDLALSLVESDLGPEVALLVARLLVVFLHRPGGQSQFSAALGMRPHSDQRFRSLMTRIAERPADDHSVEAMAARVGMSPRNFARVFKRETGVTPAAYVERSRLESARGALEVTDAGVDAIAAECGFGTSETLRRAFRRAFGISPSAYRERFSRQPAAF